MAMKKILLVLAVMGVVAVACDTEEAERKCKDEAEDVLDFPPVAIPEGEVEPIARVDVPLTKVQEEIAAGTVDFSFRMLQETDTVLADKGNVVLSPISASVVLSMLANGAAGDTRQEIIDALGFKGKDITAINDYSSLILKTFPGLDNTGVLSFANSMWLNSGYGSTGFYPYDSFESELEDVYDSEIHSFDFADGPELINAWCSKKTNDLIPEILEDLDADSQMALVNALYFKGKWEAEFSEKNTKRDEFTTADGDVRYVDMMNGRREVLYLAAEKYALAELPFGNGAFSFQVVLPAEGVAAEECLAGFKADEWLADQEKMSMKNLEIKLPKFKVEMNESIVTVLMALGMRNMFHVPLADFSNLSERTSVVSEVRQATYFSVDEKGSEAAAVTIAVLLESAGPDQKEPEYIPFHVNRPFLFVLKEASTNSILFIGKISEL